MIYWDSPEDDAPRPDLDLDKRMLFVIALVLFVSGTSLAFWDAINDYHSGWVALVGAGIAGSSALVAAVARHLP